MDTIIAIIIMVLAVELWLPLAAIFGLLKFAFTFSVTESWIAFKSVPLWIWDFVHGLF